MNERSKVNRVMRGCGSSMCKGYAGGEITTTTHEKWEYRVATLLLIYTPINFIVHVFFSLLLLYHSALLTKFQLINIFYENRFFVFSVSEWMSEWAERWRKWCSLRDPIIQTLFTLPLCQSETNKQNKIYFFKFFAFIQHIYYVFHVYGMAQGSVVQWEMCCEWSVKRIEFAYRLGGNKPKSTSIRVFLFCFWQRFYTFSFWNGGEGVWRVGFLFFFFILKLIKFCCFQAVAWFSRFMMVDFYKSLK